MREKNLFIFDPISAWGHAFYNKRIYDIVLNLFKVKIYLYGFDSYKHIFQRHKNLEIYRYKKKFKVIARLSYLYSHIKFLKIASSTNTPALFLSFDNILLFIALVISCVKIKNLSVICHNNLQSAKTSKINAICLKYLKFTKIKVVVCEKWFQKFLINDLSFNNAQLYTVYHPLLDIKKLIVKNNIKGNNVSVSYISGASYTKGIHVMLRAVERFSRLNANTTITFKLFVGDLNSLEIKEQNLVKALRDCPNVTIYQSYIPQKAYDYILSKSSYICFPFLDDFYCRCSAVFFEAISYNTPVIASNIEIFQKYFNHYGDFGFLFDNVNSLIKIFNNLELYNQNKFCNHIYKFQQCRSDSIIRKQVAEVLNVCHIEK